MASQAALRRGGNDADHLIQDMAAKLLVMLSAHVVEEKGGRKAWDQLQEKLAEVATYVASPRITVDALLGLLESARESSSLCLGHPEAEALLRQIMASLEEETTRALDSGKAVPRLRELLLVVAQQLGMVPLRDSDPVHMVDEDSNFCESSVAGMVKSSPQLSAPDAPYAVVSIVGAQSSGKSYLLNRLFGTKFPEMDAKRGRSQTTRGIMMSRCSGPSLLVLDIEGFDGREKAQDTLFEKQAALLALTISDIMLVNMNVFDIGREEAVGTLLFRTIFKERRKLEAGLTKILVVLRMYDGETPMETLRNDVMNSMEKMWRSVNMKSVKFEEYIEVNVIGLPDKDSQDFPKEVTTLRRLLSNTTLDRDRSAKVSASSFSVSSRILWDAIKRNENLDIPSHQEALGRLFCQQTVDNALDSVESSEEYKLLKAEESPRRFKEISNTLMERITTRYDDAMEMYDPEVRVNGRQCMVEKLKKVFTEVSRELIRKMRRNTLEQFKGECARNHKHMEETDADLNFAHQLVQSWVDEFMHSCEDLKAFDSVYLQMKCAELHNELHSYIIYHVLTIKETRWRKETELARERSDKNLDEVLKKLDETTRKRQLAEQDMRSQNEKQLKEELEYTRRMLAKQQEMTEQMLANQQDQTERMLAKQDKRGFTFNLSLIPPNLCSQM